MQTFGQFGVKIKTPTIAAGWRRNWSQVIPFDALPRDIQRAISPTYCHRGPAQVPAQDNQGNLSFPNDDAAMNQFAILYGYRFIHARALHGPRLSHRAAPLWL